MKKILLVFTLLVLNISLPATGKAQIKEVALGVYGMTCQLCESAYEKQLKKIEGVQSAKARLDKGKAWVQLASDANLDISALEKATKDSGITLDKVNIVATGELFEQDGNLALRVFGSKQVFLLTMDSNQNKGTFLSYSGADEIRKKAGTANRLTIKGNVHDHGEIKTNTLNVTSIENS